MSYDVDPPSAVHRALTTPPAFSRARALPAVSPTTATFSHEENEQLRKTLAEPGHELSPRQRPLAGTGSTADN